MKLKRKPYTVVLILPDYIADNYGEEFYHARVTATTPKRALTKARRMLDKELKKTEGEGLNDLSDACLVAMYNGHLARIEVEE